VEIKILKNIAEGKQNPTKPILAMMDGLCKIAHFNTFEKKCHN
jgi:hypothetical protein